MRPSSKTFVKRDKLQNVLKLKLKDTTSADGQNSETANVKRYKTSFKTSSTEERRASKVEFKDLPQTNLIY